MTIGNRLKIARKSKGITQDKLAELIGTSRGVISNLELNRTETQQPIIINAICSVLEINPDWLMTGDGEMDNPKSAKSDYVLNEITAIAKNLSEKEQLYILDLIKTYQKHIVEK